MRRTKFVVVSCLALVFTAVAGLAAAANPSPEPMLKVAAEQQQAITSLPTTVAPVLLPTRTPVQPVVIETDDVELATQQLFAQIPTAVAPTGILLERDATDSVAAIRKLDGSSQAPATTYEDFNVIASELVAQNDIADLEILAQENRRLAREQSVVPINVMLINYDTFGDNASSRVTLDQNQQLKLTTAVADATTNEVMFAVGIDSPSLSYLDGGFILPSAGFISNMVNPAAVTNITISIAGSAPQTISFDRPFTIANDFIGMESLTATITLKAAGTTWVGAAVRDYDKPTAEAVRNVYSVKKMRGPISSRTANSRSNPGDFSEAKCEIPCYDLDTVEQQIDFAAPTGESVEKGEIYPRAYPRKELAAGKLLGPTVVFVDGFDIEGNRDHKKLYKKSPDMYPMFHEAGYDVIMLDYEDGTNWIQANAFAVREFLTNHLPHYVDPAHLDQTVVVGRSMGGLVSRFALRTAELDGEEHNAKLFFSLDTPHLGANAPAGVYHALDWANRKGLFSWYGPVKALSSPAAAQQLRRLPNSNDELVAPAQHIEFMNLMAELGVPQSTRNIALSNGSGSGSTQTGRDRWTDLGETNPSHPIMRVNAPFGAIANLFVAWTSSFGKTVKEGLTDIKLEVDTNHTGRVFSAEKKRYILGFITITTTEEHYVGAEANYVDIAPGGNISKFSRKILSRVEPIEAPGFVPTISGLMYGDPADIFAIPAFDEELLNKTPFDDVFADQCNTEHATFTDNMAGVVTQELIASRENSNPAFIQRPTARCGDRNRANLCYQPARVYGADGKSRLSVVNFDGEYCQVAAVPEGRTGFVQNDGLYLEPAVACPAGSLATATGCGFTELPENRIYAYTDRSDLIIISHTGNGVASYCPRNTTFKTRAGMALRCELQMPQGYTGRDLRISMAGNLEYKIDIQDICPDGRKFQGIRGGQACVVGSVPENTTGLIHDGHFVYDEN